jgi:hypothetical protein
VRSAPSVVGLVTYHFSEQGLISFFTSYLLIHILLDPQTIYSQKRKAYYGRAERA